MSSKMNGAFTREERAAMRERARELKSEAREMEPLPGADSLRAATTG